MFLFSVNPKFIEKVIIGVLGEDKGEKEEEEERRTSEARSRKTQGEIDLHW